MTSIIIALGCLLTTFLVLVEWQSKQTRRAQRQKLGLINIGKIKNLTSLAQKHRGTCVAYLQGDKSVQTSIDDLRSDIEDLIANLNKEPQLQQQERWLSFIDHWQRFKQHSLQLSVTNSFEQHNNLISNLLFLFEDMAEYQGLTKNKFSQLANIALVWRELPLTVEYIAQARAIGSAVTVARKCAQADKVKLGDLQKKIGQLSRIVFHYVLNNAKHNNNYEKIIQLANEACKQLTHTIQRELIDKAQVTLTPENYFAQASQAMEATNKVLENELQQLSLVLES